MCSLICLIAIIPALKLDMRILAGEVDNLFLELILRNSTVCFEVVNEMFNIVSWLISPNICIVLRVNTPFNFFKNLWRTPLGPQPGYLS